MQAFLVVNIPDVSSEFSDLVERLTCGHVVEDELLDRRPVLHRRRVDAFRDSSKDEEPADDIPDHVSSVDRRVVLVGLVDVGYQVPVGDLIVVNAGESFEPDSFARVDLFIDRVDGAGKYDGSGFVPNLDDLPDLDHVVERWMIDCREGCSSPSPKCCRDREGSRPVCGRCSSDHHLEISHSMLLRSGGSRCGTGSRR